MKQLKRCDGYVLPYVLVVFLILSAVAVSICSTSLNNLKAQEAAVERSKALYEAEGEVEKFVAAKLLAIPLSDGYTSESAARNALQEEAKKTAEEGEDRVTFLETAGIGEDSFSLTLNAESTFSSARIRVVLRVKLDIESYLITVGEGDQSHEELRYKIVKIAPPIYESYDISYQGGDAG